MENEQDIPMALQADQLVNNETEIEVPQGNLLPFNSEYIIVAFSIVMSIICILHFLKHSKKLKGHRMQVNEKTSEIINDSCNISVSDSIVESSSDLTAGNPSKSFDIDTDKNDGMIYKSPGYGPRVPPSDSFNVVPDKNVPPGARYEHIKPPGTSVRQRWTKKREHDHLAATDYDDMYI